MKRLMGKMKEKKIILCWILSKAPGNINTTKCKMHCVGFFIFIFIMHTIFLIKQAENEFFFRSKKYPKFFFFSDQTVYERQPVNERE